MEALVSDVTHILRAAAAGDAAGVRACLAADPGLATASSMLGSTAAHAAHFAGHSEIVELLIASGATLDAHLAAQLGMTHALAGFLDANPSLLHALDARGATLLADACYWGQVEMARLLLDRGADPDQPTADGFLDIRPLGAAVATPDTPNPSDDEATVVALATLLLDRGADVNGRRKDGLTALHSAGYRGLLDVIRLLLARGADPRIAGLPGGRHAGETPADMAEAQGQNGAAALLRDAG
jgi:ankyrin repeat protein